MLPGCASSGKKNSNPSPARMPRCFHTATADPPARSRLAQAQTWVYRCDPKVNTRDGVRLALGAPPAGADRFRDAETGAPKGPGLIPSLDALSFLSVRVRSRSPWALPVGISADR